MSESGENFEGKVKYLEKGKKLKASDIDFMKLIEQQNLERVRKLQRTRRNNIITGNSKQFPISNSERIIFCFLLPGLLLGGGVFGIYAYSMLAVQQEKFLDDFEEPQKEKVESN
jgi:hypothetical protein